MTDEQLKKILSHYRVPEPSPFLEAKVLARIEREGTAQPVPEVPPVLSWQTLACATALSLMLALATGYALGVRQTTLQMFDDPTELGG